MDTSNQHLLSSECRVYWALQRLGLGVQPVRVPITHLAQSLGLSYNTVHRAVLRLAKTGAFVYHPGVNQWRPSRFEQRSPAPSTASVKTGEAKPAGQQDIPRNTPGFPQPKTGPLNHSSASPRIGEADSQVIHRRSEKLLETERASFKTGEANPNDNDIINIYNSDGDNDGDRNSTGLESSSQRTGEAKAHKSSRPRTRQEALALHIARVLKDEKNLKLYLSYSRRYPESILLRAFAQAKETPNHNIRKSKGALFNYLVKKYANQQ